MCDVSVPSGGHGCYSIGRAIGEILELAVKARPDLAPLSALVAFKMFAKTRKLNLPPLDSWTADKPLTSWQGVEYNEQKQIDFYKTAAHLLPVSRTVTILPGFAEFIVLHCRFITELKASFLSRTWTRK